MRRALPPVGWHKRVEQPLHITTVWAWLNEGKVIGLATRTKVTMDQKQKEDGKWEDAPENGGDVHASLAADIHEERVGRLDQSALLVLSLLNGNVGVEEIVLNQLKSLQAKKKKPNNTTSH